MHARCALGTPVERMSEPSTRASTPEDAEPGSPEPAPVAEPAIPLLGEALTHVAVWRPDRRQRRVAWLILLLGALFYFPNAGSFGLWDPWETHYGEVTRMMVESHDFVSPWWGFKQKIGTESQQGSAFFSKPVYLFWTEAIFVKAIGFSEWAIRLPVACIAWLAMFSIYLALSRILGARHGVFAAVVAATSPQFFFLGRQAQTDMPFVGTLTIALCFFMLAAFGPREELSPAQLKRRFAWVLGLILFSTLPQYGVIATDLAPSDEAMKLGGFDGFLARAWGGGAAHAALYSVMLLATLGFALFPFFRAWWRNGPPDAATTDLWVRRLYLWVFYVMAGHSTLAKGLLGFMLPGAILFFFILLTSSWRVLRRVELLRGSLLFICVAFPWYVAMFAEHGTAYWTRFFIHDHFNRLGAGVHQIDSGTFEHFLKWLGYGLFPWAGLAPFALVPIVSLRLRTLDRTRAAQLFLFLWFFVSYVLFTVSKTKFHHYIFPALPALAALIGCGLASLRELRPVHRRALALVGAGLTVAIALNLKSDPQSLRNLFTYKYDRPMPPKLPTDVDGPIAVDDATPWGESLFYEDTNPLILNLLNNSVFQYDTVILWVAGLAAAGFLAFAWSRSQKAGAWALSGSAALLTVYGLNVYLPMLSPHWSQKHIFDRYFELCTPLAQQPEIEEAYEPLVSKIGLASIAVAAEARSKKVCREDVVSWLITWRGETVYSYNEIRPISKESAQFEDYLQRMNRGHTFYVLIERGKEKSLATKLNGTYLKKPFAKEGRFAEIEKFEVEKVFNENHYFILVKVTPVMKKGSAGA